ncbi:MAG: TetR/AcrR family transcriptional regulator [Candidatus Dormibacteraceae bacterium]
MVGRTKGETVRPTTSKVCSAAGNRRQELVEAAFAQIARKGLEGLRLREVAAAVDLDNSTLHHYFPTKEDLIANVVEYATGQLLTTLRPEGSPTDQIRRHLRLMARVMREWPELFVVLCELNLRATRDPVVRTIIDRSDQGWRSFIKARLDEGAWPQGLDSIAGAELIIAAIKGIIFNPGIAADAFSQLERLLVDNKQEI